MLYEEGKVYSFDGVSRIVTGFDGQGNPITKVEKTVYEPDKQPPFICPECNKECANGAGLSAHIRSAHH